MILNNYLGSPHYSAKKASLQHPCNRQHTLILAEVVVSHFGKSSPKKGLGIPPEAEAAMGGVRVPMNDRECLRTAGCQFQCEPDSGIVYLEAIARRSVPEHMLNMGALARATPFDGETLDGTRVVRHSHSIGIGPNITGTVWRSPPEN